jgi:hypothetical protein
MTGNKFVNIIIFLSFNLIASLPTNSLDGEQENPGLMARGLRSLYTLVNAMTDDFDEVHGVDLYLPVEHQCEPFFPEQTDEVSLMVFTWLCMDKTDITSLRVIALTSTCGYRLVQDVYFGRILMPYLRPIGFSHLPQEYTDILIQGKEEVGLKMGDALLRQLFTFQMEETRQLSDLLQSKPSKNWPQSESILINKVSQDAKKHWLFKLTMLWQLELGLHELEDAENLERTENSPFKRYLAQEEILDSINSDIVEHCFAFIGIQSGLNVAQIRLACCLTRLSQKGAEYIRNWLLVNDHHIDGIVLDLSYNHLRWIPDEAFFPKLQILKLSNNQLCYLPSKIECVKEHLCTLEIGNYEPFNPLFTARHSRRTTGNIFRKFPPVIFEFSKLTDLGLNSVQLDEFCQAEVFKALPALNYLNVANNNLSIIPISGPERRIAIDSYGNPESMPLPVYQRIGDYCYDNATRFCGVSIKALEFSSLNPIRCAIGVVTLATLAHTLTT